MNQRSHSNRVKGKGQGNTSAKHSGKLLAVYLQVCQHLGSGGFEVELHGKLEVVVHCVESCRDGQESAVARIPCKADQRSIHGSSRSACALRCMPPSTSKILYTSADTHPPLCPTIGSSLFTATPAAWPHCRSGHDCRRRVLQLNMLVNWDTAIKAHAKVLQN